MYALCPKAGRKRWARTPDDATPEERALLDRYERLVRFGRPCKLSRKHDGRWWIIVPFTGSMNGTYPMSRAQVELRVAEAEERNRLDVLNNVGENI